MLGIAAELWYLPSENRPNSVLPQWDALEKYLLQHFCAASRTTLNISRRILDGTTRCEIADIDVSTYGDMRISADVDFPWEESMAGASEWFNGLVYGRTVAAAVLDASLFLPTLVPSGSILGVWADWLIVEWNHTHPLNGAQRIRMRMVPGWSGWVVPGDDAPAQVTRFYPEIINPYSQT